jgi:hypothetical protein
VPAVRTGTTLAMFFSKVDLDCQTTKAGEAQLASTKDRKDRIEQIQRRHLCEKIILRI